jgi:Uma2 family endonuclease
VSEAAQRFATYEDVLAAPEHLIAELIYGTLVTSPRPAPAHAIASSGLGMTLGAPFQFGRGGPGGWWILDEPELHLAANVLVPDLAGWRRERMPGPPETAYFELAPDWLCEVLSPSTEARDRTDKLAIYAAAGVAWVWLLNPNLRTLEVLQLVNGQWLLHSSHRGDVGVRAPPFEAVELALSDLWVPENPDPAAPE